MITIDLFCFLIIICSTAYGAWRGWATQGFYLLLLVVLYGICLRITGDHFEPLFLMDVDIPYRKIVRLILSTLLVLLSFIYFRRFHKIIFVSAKDVPAHHVAGAVMGFLTGFIALLYAGTVFNLSDLSNEEWWKNSNQFQLSHFVPKLLNFCLDAINT